jgi:hypothetical protein
MLSFSRVLTTVFILVSEKERVLSLKLLKSYLENRRQRIKIGNNYSEWDILIKGVP